MQPVKNLFRGRQPVRVVGDVLHARMLTITHDDTTFRDEPVAEHVAQLLPVLIRDLLDQLDLPRAPWSACPFLWSAESDRNLRIPI